MVNGKVVVKDGQLVNIDERKLQETGLALLARVYQRRYIIVGGFKICLVGFGKLTWSDIENIDKEKALCILPVASIEQHGPTFACSN